MNTIIFPCTKKYFHNFALFTPRVDHAYVVWGKTHPSTIKETPNFEIQIILIVIEIRILDLFLLGIKLII